MFLARRPLGPVGCLTVALLVSAVLWYAIAEAGGHVIQVFGS